MDVYEETQNQKPRFRVRLADGFKLNGCDFSGDWLVVPTADDGELAVDLRRATRLHVRERTEHDERAYEEKRKLTEPETNNPT